VGQVSILEKKFKRIISFCMFHFLLIKMDILRFSDPQVPKIESVEFKTNDVSPFHSID
jgi:hypothetical protein